MELQMVVPNKPDAQEMLSVSEQVFGREYNESLVHQIVVAQLAGERQGSKANKNRSAVRGGGRKPWRQKGTGNARAGTIRSPIWVGGGVTFAATPRNYSQKVNKKMHRAAIQVILSELVRQDRLLVIENIACSEPKTKELMIQLKALGLDDVLIVTREFDDNLYLSSRNIPLVDVATVTDVDSVSLVGYGKVLMTLDALKYLEETLG